MGSKIVTSVESKGQPLNDTGEYSTKESAKTDGQKRSETDSPKSAKTSEKSAKTDEKVQKQTKRCENDRGAFVENEKKENAS